jgi:hypothetical protein
MWHFGVDGLTEYTGEKFSSTWEVGQNALIRAYTKDFTNGRTHIRLERQEYPRISLACAIEEKINLVSTTTWSNSDLRLYNRPQSEPRSRVYANTENSQSPSYGNRPLCDDDNAKNDYGPSDRDPYVEVSEQELESQYIEVPRKSVHYQFQLK